MRKRGNRGDGAILNKGRGVWEVQMTFGTNKITGKRERVTRTVHGTKADARKVRDQMRKEHEMGIRVDASKMTFAEFAKEWHESRVVSGSFSRASMERESNSISRLNAVLGPVSLRDITAPVIREAYSKIQQRREESSGKRYSGTTMNMTHGTLKQILSQAVNDDIILQNPCNKVTAPRADEPERRSLSADEAARLLSRVEAAEIAACDALAAKEKRQFERGNGLGRSCVYGIGAASMPLAVRIALSTGMRRGEVLGLLWDSVDASKGVVSVRRSLTAWGELKPPKSRSGIRAVAVDGETMNALNRWRKRQRAELLKLGIVQGDETPVLCDDKGGLIRLDNFERWWRRFRDESGFPGLKFHELRHTQATQLLAHGVDIKTVQARLGHSTASLTLDLYAHAVPDNDEKAARLMGDILAAKPRETRILKARTA